MKSVRLMSSSQAIFTLLRTGKIQDKTTENIFSIRLNSVEAEVQYIKDGNTYDLVHTNIPEEYEGHGLGSLLAERVFDHLVERKKKIKLTCEFLQHFYSKNKAKYQNHVIDG